LDFYQYQYQSAYKKIVLDRLFYVISYLVFINTHFQTRSNFGKRWCRWV